MTTKRPAKGRDIGMHQTAVDREYAKEKSERKCDEVESDVAFLRAEIESLKKRVSDLENVEN